MKRLKQNHVELECPFNLVVLGVLELRVGLESPGSTSNNCTIPCVSKSPVRIAHTQRVMGVKVALGVPEYQQQPWEYIFFHLISRYLQSNILLVSQVTRVLLPMDISQQINFSMPFTTHCCVTLVCRAITKVSKVLTACKIYSQ